MFTSACNPAPKYVKPATPAPVAYKESAPQEFKEGKGWKVAQPSDDFIRPKWWEIYNDGQLSALEERVAVANRSIAASEANYRAARALVVSARSALFPTIGASPSYINSRFSSTARGSQVVIGTLLNLALTRYRTGLDSYLNVITAQNTVLSDRGTQVQAQLRQMTSSIGLIMALGGGWHTADLPQMKDLLARPPKWSPGGSPITNPSDNAVAAPNPL